MFRKFVSNLPFTPSLLPQISFYAKRLAQESATRKLGVMFAALTLILQSVLFVTPPQPSLASSNNDVIFGGLSSNESQAKEQLINHVFRGDKAMVSPYNNKKYYDLDKLFLHFNITENDIRKSSKVTICSQCNEQDKQKRSVGRLPNSVDATKDVKFTPSNSRYPYYLRPLSIWDSGNYSKYDALKIRDGVWILLNCGNIVVDKIPDANVEITKTQNPRNGSKVKPGTIINYSLTIKNTGTAAAQHVEIRDPYPDTNIFHNIKVNKGSASTVSDRIKIDGRQYSRWTFSDLKPGQEVSVSLSMQLRAGPSLNDICNTAEVRYRNAEGDSRKDKSNQVCFDRENPPASYSCSSLVSQNSLTGVAPHTVSFTTNYSLQGARFEKQVYYIDGSEAGSSKSNSFEHTFNEPGEYRIHTIVQTNEGSAAQTEDCAQTVKISPPAATFQCQRLFVNGDVLGTERLSTSFEVDYVVENTTLTSFNFFINGKPQPPQTEPLLNYTFNEIGSHTVHVILVTEDGSTEKSDDCSAVVSVEETPDNSVDEDKTARVITGFNPVNSDDSDPRSASVDGQTVSAGELIEYELTIINSGNVSYDDQNPYQPPAESLVDVLEYADVIDEQGNVMSASDAVNEPIKLFGGGTLDGGQVIWPEIVAFDPGSTIKKSILIKIKDVIPKTNTPPSDPFSYDCTMSNTYINSSTVNINVECPPEKVVESTISSLPNTGPLQTAMLTGGFAVLAFYLFSRNQLLVKELQLIQSEYSGGPLR